MKRHFMAYAFVLPLVAGCYVDRAQDREEIGSTQPGAGKTPVGECRYSLNSGCFEGEIPAAPNVSVKDKNFFDVNDLKTRFKELITVKLDSRDGEEPAFTLLTQLDNKSFAKGFQIFVKGEDSRSAEPLATGGFVLNKLPEGVYQVRVAKPVKFKLSQTINQTDPANPDAPAQPVLKEKTFCATLFAETAVEIRVGERTRYVFDDYELYVTDNACAESQTATTLSL
jgi:hypothetical protein